MLFEINNCEICDNINLTSILNLGFHPLCDDLITLGDSRVCKEYPIEILFCEKCITAHQRFQIRKQQLFPRNYHYRAKHTVDVLNGMREVVEFCERSYGDLKEKKILDIGCNDGSLLSFFKEKGAKTYGIEPTDAFKDAIKYGHKIINDFFCEDSAIEFVKKFGKPDFITFTNVFAHIEDLKKVIDALKIIMQKQTVIIIENHYLGSVIDKFQFDTFYHEHPRTYSCTSFSYIADKLNLTIETFMFPSRYNGNIRVILRSESSDKNENKFIDLYEKEKLFSKKLFNMEKKILPWCYAKRSEIELLVHKFGHLPAKAFPGRAAILVKILKLDIDFIHATYEKSQSNKINHYIPGTRIPILSDEKFNFLETKTPLLNLAWHIPAEIRSYLQKKGYFGRVIDILSVQDCSI